MPDMIAGRIHFMIDTSANSVPQVRAGAIKGFAVTAKTRMPALPDVPSVDEAGLPGFYSLNWHGLWVPKGTPKAIIDKLNDAVVQALAHPSVQQRLADLGTRYSRASSKRRKAPPPSRRPKSNVGGRSSRRLTSAPSSSHLASATIAPVTASG